MCVNARGFRSSLNLLASTRSGRAHQIIFGILMSCALKSVEAGCVGWYQTGGCSASGPRESQSDQGCNVYIQNGWSGEAIANTGSSSVHKTRHLSGVHAVAMSEAAMSEAATSAVAITYRFSNSPLSSSVRPPLLPRLLPMQLWTAQCERVPCGIVFNLRQCMRHSHAIPHPGGVYCNHAVSQVQQRQLRKLRWHLHQGWRDAER
jgi:hypothetical protein